MKHPSFNTDSSFFLLSGFKLFLLATFLFPILIFTKVIGIDISSREIREVFVPLISTIGTLFLLISFPKVLKEKKKYALLLIIFLLLIWLSAIRTLPSLTGIQQAFMMSSGLGVSCFVLAYVKKDEEINGIVSILLKAGILASFVALSFFFRDIVIKHHQIYIRLGRPFGHPNNAATFFAVILPIGWMYFRQKSTWKAKFFYGTGCLLLFVDLLLTKSRGTWAALLFSIMIWHLLHDRQKLFKAFLPLFWGIVFLILAFITSRQFFRLDYYTFSFALNYRLELWDFAISTFLQHPITGIGLGKFQLLDSSLFNLPYPPEHLHNQYLEFLVEGGLSIFLLFLIIIILPLIVSVRKSIKNAPFSLFSGIYQAYLVFLFVFLIASRLKYFESIVLFFLLQGIIYRFGNLNKNSRSCHGGKKNEFA